MRCQWLKAILTIALLTFSLSVRPEELFDSTCKSKCSKVDEIVTASQIASEVFGVDLAIILAIMKVESSFILKAKNGRSVGLMQVNLDYHKSKFKGKDPYGVYDNVFIGTSIFKDCLNSSRNNVNKALRCYNGSHNSNEYPTKVFAALKSINVNSLIKKEI